jgi:hypothetical protein
MSFIDPLFYVCELNRFCGGDGRGRPLCLPSAKCSTPTLILICAKTCLSSWVSGAESQPAMEKLTPEDLRDVLIALQTAELDAVLVGGQAVNLWAYQDFETLPQLNRS